MSLSMNTLEVLVIDNHIGELRKDSFYRVDLNSVVPPFSQSAEVIFDASLGDILSCR